MALSLKFHCMVVRESRNKFRSVKGSHKKLGNVSNLQVNKKQVININ